MTCIFCGIVSGAVPARVVRDTERSLAFMDAFPLAPGHTLVVPKRHCGRIQDMDGREVSDAFGLAAELASKTDSLAGSTLLAVHNGPEAGQEIPHVHIHLVPRGGGDGAGPIHSAFSKTCAPHDAERILRTLKGV